MNKILKIAQEIYAVNFNKYQNKDRILLLNQVNKQSIEYIVFIKNQKYLVFKIKNYKQINKEYGLNIDQIINALSYSDFIDIKNNIYLYSNYFQFDKKQLCKYFIDEIGMEINQFENYFNIQLENNKTYKYKDIVFSIYNNCIEKDDAQYCIDQIYNIKHKEILHNLKINFVEKIIQKDSQYVGGNIGTNINNFRNVINITNQNILKNLFHEIGHIYQDTFINKQKAEQIYEYVLDHQDELNIDSDYMFIETELIPELFCAYYYNYQELNQFTINFIQKEILK